MTSNSPLAYPAEYYYPEFADNRLGDPRKSPPLTPSIDHGTSSRRIPVDTKINRNIPLTPPTDYGFSSTRIPVNTTINRNIPLTSSLDYGISSTKIPVNATITKKMPLTSSIDNGIGSTKIPLNTTITKKMPLNKKSSSPGLAFDISTNQGLPATDITQAIKTDPKKNLLRDPAERNIPRLIVDQSVIQQSVRTPRIMTTNLDNDFAEQRMYSNQINNGRIPLANRYTNGHANGDLTKQQPIKYVEDQQPIDDYWKKEVYIDDQGVVTIEPLKYDRNTYEGPFGLTRQGSFVFYITMGIFTLLAGIFLIMTGVFYGQSYPDSSSNTGKLAGIGICALAFYLGLQLILIGLWHQTYRQENPKKSTKTSNKHNESPAQLRTSMEQNEPYNYSYPQPMDYTPYENYANPPYEQYANPPYEHYANPPYEHYANPPYVSTINEQMLLQQPGVVTGAGYYEPVVWPSNVQVETQLDSKFLQPMEWTYGSQPVVESPSTVVHVASPSNATYNKNDNINIKKHEKKSHRHRYNKRTVQADPPKAKFDGIVPNSTVIEAPLPVLPKAPETRELMRSIAEMEKNNQQNSPKKNSNRIKPVDDGTEISSTNGYQNHHRHHSRRRHHRHNRHHSRSSCSTCSTYSDRSNESSSDVGYRHHHHQHSKPVEKITTPRTIRTRTSSSPRRNRKMYRNTSISTELQTKLTRDSSVTTNLEDVPNIRDNRLEQIPVLRRTIIVEPYPAEPSSQIYVKPQSDMTEKIRLDKNEKLNEEDEKFISPPTTLMNKKSKKKKKKKTTENNNEHIQDLKLEDVNDVHDTETENIKSAKKNTSRASLRKTLENTFHD